MWYQGQGWYGSVQITIWKMWYAPVFNINSSVTMALKKHKSFLQLVMFKPGSYSWKRSPFFYQNPTLNYVKFQGLPLGLYVGLVNVTFVWFFYKLLLVVFVIIFTRTFSAILLAKYPASMTSANSTVYILVSRMGFLKTSTYFL